MENFGHSFNSMSQLGIHHWEEHLANAPWNATYASPNIQNQMIKVLGDHILQKILTKVKQAKYFSLIADLVTDCSNKQQLVVLLRYVDSDDCSIREDLMSFLNAIVAFRDGFLQRWCLHFSGNMIWTLPSYVGKATMVPAICLAKSKVLQHV